MATMVEVKKLVGSGVYDAEISEVKTIKGNWGPRINLIFELDDRRKVGGFYPDVITPNNKLGKLIRLVFGDIDTDKFDLEELIGKRVLIQIETTEKDGDRYSNVKEVIGLTGDGDVDEDEVEGGDINF